MGIKYGFECGLYYLTTGSRTYWPGSALGDKQAYGPAPDNLAEIDDVQDVELNLDPNEWDATTRDSYGWDQSEPTTHKGEITFSIIYDPAVASCLALENAFINRTALAILAINGEKDEDGAKGLWADMKVLGWRRGEQLRNGVVINVTLKPCRSTVHPQIVWIDSTSSSGL